MEKYDGSVFLGEFENGRVYLVMEIGLFKRLTGTSQMFLIFAQGDGQ